MILRYLLPLLLLFSVTGQASYRAVSTLSLPQQVVPSAQIRPWQGKMLRVGILRDNSAPWNMVVGDDLYGINADYLAAISHSAGLQFRIEGYSSWTAMLHALQQDQLDLLFGVPQRSLPSNFYATPSWYDSPLRIYRNRSNQRSVMFNSTDARIAISRATRERVNPLFAQHHQWRVLDSDLQALYTLLNKQNDYVVADETSASFLLDQLQQGQIYQIESPLDPGLLHLQAITRDVKLTRALESVMRQLPMDIVNDIQGRWSRPLPRYLDTNTARLTPMESEWMVQHPVITYAALADDYPWSYRTIKGEASGYSVELLNAIGQNTGLRFQPYWVANAQQASALIQQQRAQLQLMKPLTGDAEIQDSHTVPIWRALWGVYVGNTARRIVGWQDLQGLRIGVRRGDIARQLVPESLSITPYDEGKSLYDALTNGQLDAVVDNVLSARWLIQTRYNGSVHLAFAASDTAWPIAIGVSPQQPLLRAIMDKGLQQIPAATQQRMRDNWSNNVQLSSGSENNMRPVSLFMLVTALFAIAFLLILLVRRYLQQRRDAHQRRQLEQQREEADRANRMKSQFLATVSHELRTPMQAILGLLEMEVARQPQVHNLTVIHSSALSLMTLLNDLQDHAKIENNTFTLALQAVDLEYWLNQLSDFYHPLMRHDGPAFRVRALSALPTRVMLDIERLQQIANNLIGNAIKFTHSGEILLTLDALDEQICLQVQDSGTGIPADEQQRLFEPWYQTPSGKALSIQGSGLGLSICREIVTRMGGSITLHSLPGRGTTVRVLLPLVMAEERDNETTPPPNLRNAPSLAGLRVAIVDDHPTNLLVMQQQLAHCGVAAETYRCGRALLRASAEKPFDVLFIDYNMPHPDGRTVARILRRRERHQLQKTTLVLCSADAQALALSTSLQFADRVLLKPVSLTAIESALQSHNNDPFSDLDQQIKRLANQQASFVPRIVSTLISTLQSDRDALEQALTQQNWSMIEKIAHRMKGSWLLLGYSSGERLCQQMVENAKKHADSTPDWNLLILLTNRLLTKLENYGTSTFAR
ncbi:hybrid sensor histidine kinase/response regulator [[Pantoea] beijingensis]|uniref:hybrid sensor histidine kinase/response regulator n=1 Tax=[Pantoea] beijingensis TaxID=1324864 RepID=UPI001F42583F|nr:ATP-binding protein [[Pantoea] beijingensis]